MRGERSSAYVERVLIPEPSAGDVVVLDEPSCHTQRAVRQAIEAAGCRVSCRPAYSPDCGPPEWAFSKLGRLPRQAAARAVEALWEVTGRLLDRFGPEERAGYFRHRGYTATPPRKAL